MSKSVRRVEQAAKDAGLDITIADMPESTRTAAEAAAACGCDVGQIVKSLIFEGERSGALMLLLVSGQHDVDLPHAATILGESLARADPKRVRSDTGFAIGGVAPIGHLTPLATYIDRQLLAYPSVWAAAGKPNAVFEVDPRRLAEVTRAVEFAPQPTR